MPCYTEPPSVHALNSMGILTAEQFEAVMCGVLAAHPAILHDLNWQDIGVDKAIVQKWWEKHQQRDREREERQHRMKAEEEAEALAEYKALKERFEP